MIPLDTEELGDYKYKEKSIKIRKILVLYVLVFIKSEINFNLHSCDLVNPSKKGYFFVKIIRFVSKKASENLEKGNLYIVN